MGVKDPLKHVSLTLRTPQNVGEWGFIVSELYSIVCCAVKSETIETLDVRMTGELAESLQACFESCLESFSKMFDGFSMQWGTNIGRQEVLAAIRHLADQAKQGLLDPDTISEEALDQVICLPKKDLLVIVDPTFETLGRQTWFRRYGDDAWSAAYAEFFFTTELTADAFYAAVDAYYGRDRRRGGVSVK